MPTHEAVVVTPILPDYAQLRRFYLAGMSYTDLAEKYGTRRLTVRSKLQRGAKRAGHDWPIPDPNHERKSVRNWQDGSMEAVAVQAALVEWKERTGRSYSALAREVGVDPSLVHAVVRGDRKRIRKTSARAVLTGVGEAPHWSVRTYRPRVQVQSYAPASRPAAS